VAFVGYKDGTEELRPEPHFHLMIFADHLELDAIEEGILRRLGRLTRRDGRPTFPHVELSGWMYFPPSEVAPYIWYLSRARGVDRELPASELPPSGSRCHLVYGLRQSQPRITRGAEPDGARGEGEGEADSFSLNKHHEAQDHDAAVDAVAAQGPARAETPPRRPAVACCMARPSCCRPIRGPGRAEQKTGRGPVVRWRSLSTTCHDGYKGGVIRHGAGAGLQVRGGRQPRPAVTVDGHLRQVVHAWEGDGLVGRVRGPPGGDGQWDPEKRKEQGPKSGFPGCLSWPSTEIESGPAVNGRLIRAADGSSIVLATGCNVARRAFLSYLTTAKIHSRSIVTRRPAA
jgi:hypothetical protein